MKSTIPFSFAIVDCESCGVPMAVLGDHRVQPAQRERDVLQSELARVADSRYQDGWYFDDHMRQIPDHYHMHARPYPPGWRKIFGNR